METKGRDLLVDYLKKRGIKHRYFADKIGTSTCTLHSILKKNHVPHISILYNIEKNTLGRVTLYDWVSNECHDKTNQNE